MPEHTEEDYVELEKKHAALEDQIKKKSDDNKDKVTDLQAKLQANEDEVKTQKAKLQAMEDDKKTRDEKEKHEMATKIANYEMKSEKINESELDNKIKELEKNDTNVLQAMLPYAEGESKKHEEAKQAKQAALESNGKPRYELDDQNTETVNKQAAESKAFLTGYRSGFY